MKEVSKEEWINMKQLGKAKYLLIHWILFAAIPSAIIISVIRGFIKKFTFSYFLTDDYFKNLCSYFILCAFISVLFGLRKWKHYSKLFKTETL